MAALSRQPRTCEITECGNKHFGRGLCGPHYHRLYYLSPGIKARPTPNANPPAICSEGACQNAHLAKGLCRKHYSRLYRASPKAEKVMLPDSAVALLMTPVLCAEDGCWRKVEQMGERCLEHRAERSKSLSEARHKREYVPRPKRPVRKCSLAGCEARHFAKNLCAKHFSATPERKSAALARNEIKAIARRTSRPSKVAKACAVVECGEPYYGKGLCARHYNLTPEHRERHNAASRRYNAAHREQRAALGRRYHSNPAVKLAVAAYHRSRATSPAVKASAAKSKKRWRQNHTPTVQQRLASVLRSRLHEAIKNGQKTGSAVRDLGCSVSELKLFLESHFHAGMSWENYGRKKGIRCWEIDHHIPISRFDLRDRSQLLKAVHWTNLRPLWADLNRQKGDSLPESTCEI